MKKDNYKTESQIENEKNEAVELRDLILQKTNSIPQRVLQNGSYQMAIDFKNFAMAARKAAEGKQLNLGKLRTAWQSIQHYYE